MPIDYNLIREENIIEYGEGIRHLKFFNRLYSDRTHFIYELLQNAEDAEATKVLFQLHQDRLMVKHNGRPFNEEDVRGICGIDIGIKKDDLTKIGKFGIGFKSVYAYTSSPEIHSEGEHFSIKHYVRPEQVDAIDIDDPWTTLFILKFDAPDVEPTNAFNEIATRLGNLSVNTLLFLRRIAEIKYEVPDNENGIYRRIEKVLSKKARFVKLTGSDSGIVLEKNWLVFEKPINSNDQLGLARVEVAFYLDIDEEKKEGKYSIGKTNESPLYVYFPTEKETRLGFLIQGPYRTTPSRDNVSKDDEWNTQLIEATAVLLIEALDIIKKSNLLTVKMLSALPIKYNDFSAASLVYKIYDAVKCAFFNGEYLPAYDGSYISSQNAKLARGSELRNLLSNEQLNSLFQSTNINWLPDEITQARTPDLRDYLIKILDVTEITPEWFSNRISNKFIEEQSDEWLILFYKFISTRKDLWKKKTTYWSSNPPLISKRIIRLEDGKHVLPISNDGKPHAYLSDEFTTETSLPIVKTALTADKDVRNFLNALGIPNLDIVEEVINIILPKYINNISEEEHRRDLIKILRAFSTDSQEKSNRLKKALQKTPFVLAEIPGRGNVKYLKPEQVYFRSDELILYFDGYDQVGFLDYGYNQDVKEMLKMLGVIDSVRVVKKNPNRSGHVIIRSERGWHERGLNGFDPNCRVDGLKNALANPTIERSKYIWNNIALQHLDSIHGTVQKASKQDYSNAESEKGFSPFGALLFEMEWLPKSDKEFAKPEELYLEDLPPEFIRDEILADKLSMRNKVDAKLAEQAGIATEDIDFVKKYPDEFQKWKDTIISKAKPVFPERPIANPERREEKVLDEYEVAAEKGFEIRERSVRTSRGAIDPKTWLQNNYTNEEDKMICQICKEEMPFKKPNGEYYFEAVEAFNTLKKESEAQFIALCPLCAAMYKVFVKEDEKSLILLQKELLEAEEPLIYLALGELTTSVRFVDKHFHDLRTIINNEKCEY